LVLHTRSSVVRSPADRSWVVSVPDHGSRDRDVVLVRRTISLGKPRGVGKLERGRNGEGEVSLRATWDQGGQDRTTSKEGFQVSKGG
jgi:hypothetical protein